jgi:hypothetical protein
MTFTTRRQTFRRRHRQAVRRIRRELGLARLRARGIVLGFGFTTTDHWGNSLRFLGGQMRDFQKVVAASRERLVMPFRLPACLVGDLDRDLNRATAAAAMTAFTETKAYWWPSKQVRAGAVLASFEPLAMVRREVLMYRRAVRRSGFRARMLAHRCRMKAILRVAHASRVRWEDARLRVHAARWENDLVDSFQHAVTVGVGRREYEVVSTAHIKGPVT